MPTINRTTHRQYNHSRESRDLDRKKRMKVYNDPLWKRLRDAHLREHPLCEVCEMEGKTRLAEDVHHLISFSKGRDDNERRALAFDPRNIVALCKLCHWDIHHGRLKGCKSMEDLRQFTAAQSSL